jgi:CheY-like chemotaxis protein
MGMGGEIAVDSEVGKGTTFSVSLPPCERTLPAKEVPRAATPGRRAKVLVIDDEATIGRAVHRLLGAQNDVSTETCPREALQRLARGERFDVILCDLMMPEMSGIDLHEALTRQAPDDARRMVFLTGGAFTERARLFLERVSNPRLEKPFDPRELRSVVANALT